MKISRSKGFTLVEIMIVVAIIGIIIAIAVPAFLRARENARGQACQENLSKIDGAKEQYAVEYRLGQGATVTIGNLLEPPARTIQTASGAVTVGAATLGAGYLKAQLVCPANGQNYNINPIGSAPTCNYEASRPTWATPHILLQ